jgi:S-DNA-T family DNA segregation ATPase FtsK/SpoIIIE
MVGCWRGLVALAPPERPQSAIADGSGRPAFRAPTVPFGPPSIPQLDDEVAASGLRAAVGPPVLEPRTPDRLPPLDLLHGPQEPIPPVEAGDRGRLVAGVLADFGIAGTIGAPQAGPVVTRFAFDPAPGVRPGRVIGLADEIAHALGLRALRITTAADGGPRLIIEVPAADRLTIALAPLLKAAAFEHTAARLPIVVGADLGGGAVVDDLARHGALLIAGSPQAGVGTVLRSLLLSLVYRQPATRCRFLVVDPGGVRLAALADLPHRDQPMVTDPAAGVAAIAGLVDEVERRHRLIAKAGVRGLDAYNARVADLAGADARRLRTVQIGFDPVDNRPIYAEQPVDLAPLPILVAVVGEIAPLVASDRAAVVHALTRLAPIAAPVGVHVLVATRNPSAESLPSDLLAALPTRIVARLPGRLESRRLTGSTGAESLLGAGDCLWLEPGKPARRLHAPLVRDDELRAVARFVRERQASQPAIAA